MFINCLLANVFEIIEINKINEKESFPWAEFA
jgi:hypothetical protein